MTVKVLIFAFLLGIPLVLPAQRSNLYDGWEQAVIDRANTAQKDDYLSEEERNVILLTNLARTDGSLYTETILARWLKGKKSSRYTRSLIRELKNTSGLTLLTSQKDLYNIAKGHAVVSGKRGTAGHQRFEKRFGPVMTTYTMVAENCAYGYDHAVDIVNSLLIDEGIKSLGHRKNMLNPDFNSIGVSIEPHKKFRYNCVMDFGRK